MVSVTVSIVFGLSVNQIGFVFAFIFFKFQACFSFLIVIHRVAVLVKIMNINII